MATSSTLLSPSSSTATRTTTTPAAPQAEHNTHQSQPPTSTRYAQMRATLAEVEASATSQGTSNGPGNISANVGTGSIMAFNAAHARALEELRGAQIALAEAWGRVEGEGEGEVGEVGDDGVDSGALGVGGVKGIGLGGDARLGSSNANAGGARGGNASAAEEENGRATVNPSSVLESASTTTTSSFSAAKLPQNQNQNQSHPQNHNPSSQQTPPNQQTSQTHKRNQNPNPNNPTTDPTSLESSTSQDILLARRRRAANDRYFERVRAGVVDVVGKLEGVASRMREVEGETGSLFGSGSGSSVSESSGGGGGGDGVGEAGGRSGNEVESIARTGSRSRG